MTPQPVIGHVGEVVDWIRDHLPPLNPTRGEVWHTHPAPDGVPPARTATLQVQITSPNRPVCRLVVDLIATPDPP